jgi:hypothetical protein
MCIDTNCCFASLTYRSSLPVHDNDDDDDMVVLYLVAVVGLEPWWLLAGCARSGTIGGNGCIDVVSSPFQSFGVASNTPTHLLRLPLDSTLIDVLQLILVSRLSV